MFIEVDGSFVSNREYYTKIMWRMFYEMLEFSERCKGTLILMIPNEVW